MKRIVSRDNPTFRALAALAESARARRRLGLSLLEGVHLCEAWLDRFGEPRRAVVTESALAHPEVAALVARLAGASILLAEPLFRALSSVEHGVGLAFVVKTPAFDVPEVVEEDAVYLDRLQDPGNVGTILRTCAAVGVRRVFTAPETVWCWSPKVLRAGMGAHFHLAIHEAVPWPTLAPRVRARIRATTVIGAVDLYAADLREPSLWMFGREGDGLAAALLADVATRVSIPQAPAVESLNVGVAAAICLYEQFRQRRC